MDIEQVTMEQVVGRLEVLCRKNRNAHYVVGLEVTGSGWRDRSAIEYDIAFWDGEKWPSCNSPCEGKGRTLSEAWLQFDLALNGAPGEGELKEVDASLAGLA